MWFIYCGSLALCGICFFVTLWITGTFWAHTDGCCWRLRGAKWNVAGLSDEAPEWNAKLKSESVTDFLTLVVDVVAKIHRTPCHAFCCQRKIFCSCRVECTCSSIASCSRCVVPARFFFWIAIPIFEDVSRWRWTFHQKLLTEDLPSEVFDSRQRKR